jgi:hypothetical protein
VPLVQGYRWRGPSHASGSQNVSGQEYERMRHELAKVETERDILKALGYFAADLK